MKLLDNQSKYVLLQKKIDYIFYYTSFIILDINTIQTWVIVK